MEWFWIIAVVLVALGALGNAAEKSKKEKAQEAETELRKQRAEEARNAILASGNREANAKLQLMEASYQGQSSARTAQPTGGNGAGPGLLGTAAAVAGGMVVGNAVIGAVQMAQLEAALQDIESDLSADVEAANAEIEDVSGDEGDWNLDI